MPILSVLYMPFKALGWLKPVFSDPIGYFVFWIAAIVLSVVFGKVLRIHRLRILVNGRIVPAKK